MKTRICKKCKEKKSIGEFSSFSYTTKDGKVHISIRWTCKECMNNRYSEYFDTIALYRESHKEEIADYYKNKEVKKDKEAVNKRTQNNKKMAVEYLGGLCFDCSNSFPDCVFDFHHRDPALKITTIGKIITHSWEKIKVELDKCDLLCSNCHRIRHYAKT